MTIEDRKLALKWYVAGYDLITIAQHFNVAIEELKESLTNNKTSV